MRRTIIIAAVLVVTIVVAACGGRRGDAAYYAAKIDSLRKAEQLQQLRTGAGLSGAPVEQFFDTLQLCPLPVRSVGGNIERLAHFVQVPRDIAMHMGYPEDVDLRVLRLPRYHGHRVVLLAQEQDSVPPTLFLHTLDDACQPLDQLCIYEQRAEERGDELVMVFNDYYITSDYHITLLFAYLKNDSDYPHQEGVRRYGITPDGHIEEEVVDL